MYRGWATVLESQRVRNDWSDLACMHAQYASDNPKLLIYPSFLSPLVIIRLFSMSVGLFLIILFLNNQNPKLENRLSSLKKNKQKKHVVWWRDWLPTPIFWLGEFHELYSPWGCKESDMTEWLSLICSHGTKFYTLFTKPPRIVIMSHSG